MPYLKPCPRCRRPSMFGAYCAKCRRLKVCTICRALLRPGQKTQCDDCAKALVVHNDLMSNTGGCKQPNGPAALARIPYYRERADLGLPLFEEKSC